MEKYTNILNEYDLEYLKNPTELIPFVDSKTNRHGHFYEVKEDSVRITYRKDQDIPYVKPLSYLDRLLVKKSSMFREWKPLKEMISTQELKNPSVPIEIMHVKTKEIALLLRMTDNDELIIRFHDSRRNYLLSPSEIDKLLTRPVISRFDYPKDNPEGLHSKYMVKKIKGFQEGTGAPIPEPFNPLAEYFVLRLDRNADDLVLVDAARKAILEYAFQIKDYKPKLSQDIFEKYDN